MSWREENFFNTNQKGREKKMVNFMDKKKGDEGKNDSSTQVIEGERRKVFEVSEFLSVCRMQYMWARYL
jgi:hypothetical protein